MEHAGDGRVRRRSAAVDDDRPRLEGRRRRDVELQRTTGSRGQPVRGLDDRGVETGLRRGAGQAPGGGQRDARWERSLGNGPGGTREDGRHPQLVLDGTPTAPITGASDHARDESEGVRLAAEACQLAGRAARTGHLWPGRHVDELALDPAGGASKASPQQRMEPSVWRAHSAWPQAEILVYVPAGAKPAPTPRPQHSTAPEGRRPQAKEEPAATWSNGPGSMPSTPPGPPQQDGLLVRVERAGVGALPAQRDERPVRRVEDVVPVLVRAPAAKRAVDPERAPEGILRDDPQEGPGIPQPALG